MSPRACLALASFLLWLMYFISLLGFRTGFLVFEAAVSSSYLASLSFYTPPSNIQIRQHLGLIISISQDRVKTLHLKRDKAALFLERCGRRQLQATRWFRISRQVAGLHSLLSFDENLRRGCSRSPRSFWPGTPSFCLSPLGQRIFLAWTLGPLTYVLGDCAGSG